MLLRRLLLSSSALLLLLAGCASMGNTLAQDLAWQRVEKCQRIGAAVTVNRVEPNGTIWYEWRGGSQGVSEFEACLKNAAAEQAKQPRAVPTATAVISRVSAQLADAVSAAPRVWKLGGGWAYRDASGAVNGTVDDSVDLRGAMDWVGREVV